MLLISRAQSPWGDPRAAWRSIKDSAPVERMGADLGGSDLVFHWFLPVAEGAGPLAVSSGHSQAPREPSAALRLVERAVTSSHQGQRLPIAKPPSSCLP